MDSSVCPFCFLTVASSELERHANEHFDADDQAMDLALAQEIARAPQTPLHYSVSPKGMTFEHSDCADKESDIIEKISCLIDLQVRGDFYKSEHSLVGLLRNRLESEAENSISLLCGHLVHFHSTEFEDAGWGCGWRNIQMLSSHVLMNMLGGREVLFGGSGFVPDIASLQGWLEIAWQRGFDAVGSAHFDHKIYGSIKWIGATECATLFRSFGIRARIVDFSHKDMRLGRFISKGSRNAVQVNGPMDGYVIRRGDEESSSSNNKEEKLLSRKNKDHQVLLDWVWNYFSDNMFTISGNRSVIVDKAPLFFQHDGHSRIIVGIQVKHQRNKMDQQHNLLIFDPAHRTSALERSLEDNLGWQNLIKRGVHTLKKQQYQICYIDPGIASSEEMEQLKIIHSTLFEF